MENKLMNSWKLIFAECLFSRSYSLYLGFYRDLYHFVPLSIPLPLPLPLSDSYHLYIS